MFTALCGVAGAGVGIACGGVGSTELGSSGSIKGSSIDAESSRGEMTGGGMVVAGVAMKPNQLLLIRVGGNISVSLPGALSGGRSTPTGIVRVGVTGSSCEGGRGGCRGGGMV